MERIRAVAPTDFATFGEFLRYLRRRAGLTQRELGIACGYSTPHISYVESNRRLPDHAALLALFVPALGLQDEPELVDRLLTLATGKRRSPSGERPLAPIEPGNNLPVFSTSFIGRSDECVRVAALLNNPDCHLITIIGAGGVGKTRLAVQVATDQISHFADGVYFVGLMSVTSPERIIPTIADALNLELRTGLSAEQGLSQLADYLRHRNLLLLLDNLEHLMEGAGVISELVCRASGIKILVTSRVLLNLEEEWTFAVEGLEIPEESQIHTPTTCSSVQLFVERARQVDPVFSLAENAYAVNQICRYLDGMPLGIELAAGLLRALPPAQIAAQLDRSLEVLESSLRNLPNRHHSMRAVLEHTWGLLSDVERAALMIMSVFRGGFQREAAEYVTESPFRVLLGLVNKSLVRLHPSGRYDLHELTRQFADGKLRAIPGAWEAACDRHLEYFLDLVEGLEPLLSRSEQATAFDRLENETPNLRAALAWAHAKHDGVSQEMRLAAALRDFWFFYGHMEEGFQHLEAALERLNRAEPELQARVLYVHCLLAWRLGYAEFARVSAQRGVDLYRNSKDHPDLLWGLIGAGMADPDPASGIALLKEGLQQARVAGNRAVFVQFAQSLGSRVSRIARERSSLGLQMADETIPLMEEAITICRETGNRLMASKLYEHVSCIWVGLEDYARAEAANDARLTLLGGFVKPLAELAHSIMIKGLNAWYRGDYETANVFYEEAYRRLMQGGGDLRVNVCLSNMVRLDLDTENYEHARSRLDQLLRWVETHPLQEGHAYLAFTLTLFACLASRTGQPEQAARLAGVGDAHLEYARRRIDLPDYRAYQRDLNAAREQLGEEAFATLYMEGRQMSRDEAIAYARQVRPG